MTYWCARCGQQIVGDPHTDTDGEDVHPACCSVCHDGEWMTTPGSEQEPHRRTVWCDRFGCVTA